MNRYYLYAILLIFLHSVMNGQEADTIYYKKDWSASNEKSYKYYTVIKQNGNYYKTISYNKSGKIVKTGDFKTRYLNQPTGPHYYYKKNKPYLIQLYEPAQYPNILETYEQLLQLIQRPADTLMLFIEFYNDQLKEIGYMSGCCIAFGTWLSFSKDGSIYSIANYSYNELDGHYVSFWGEPLHIWSEGEYRQGLKEGTWKYYKFNGNLRRTIIYDKGKKIKVIR